MKPWIATATLFLAVHVVEAKEPQTHRRFGSPLHLAVRMLDPMPDSLKTILPEDCGIGPCKAWFADLNGDGTDDVIILSGCLGARCLQWIAAFVTKDGKYRRVLFDDAEDVAGEWVTIGPGNQGGHLDLRLHNEYVCPSKLVWHWSGHLYTRAAQR